LPASPDRRELSFDLVADEYERTRPDYPPELLDLLPLDASASVLDLGAGTGKLTRVLAARYAEVVAVEPLANMRKMLERAVSGVTVLAGSAERIPVDDASVDAVFAAQAFHWFDKAVALPEIARVLRAGGVFAIVWNGPNENEPNPLPATFRSELDKLHDAVEHPWKEEGEWADLLEATGLFAEVHQPTAIAHDHVLDRAGLLDNARSVSWIASRADREEVIARLGALLPEGTYAIPNLASLLWATKA
jgi:SAM-dependent methyltransferase